jgi:hypothetical protein
MRGASHSVLSSDTLLADNSLLHDEIISAFDEIFRGNLRVPLPVIS